MDQNAAIKTKQVLEGVAGLRMATVFFKKNNY